MLDEMDDQALADLRRRSTRICVCGHNIHAHKKKHHKSGASWYIPCRDCLCEEYVDAGGQR